jgi:hypothetical protein
MIFFDRIFEARIIRVGEPSVYWGYSPWLRTVVCALDYATMVIGK